jgi:hypothetical protein
MLEGHPTIAFEEQRSQLARRKGMLIVDDSLANVMLAS